MLGDISVVDDIYIVCGYTDMRKQIDGLCAIVKDQLHMDPKQRALYLFCGRRCDRIKALLYENDGFVLLYKRLTVSEGRYRWPRNKNEVQPITWRQFDWLMSGLEIEQPKAIKPKIRMMKKIEKVPILLGIQPILWYNKSNKKRSFIPWIQAE